MASTAEDAVLDDLQPEGRARLEALLAKGWSLPGTHAIGRLHDQPLGEYRLLVLLGPKNPVGSRYFQLFLANAQGRLADDSLALGIHSSGSYPAYNWVELTQYRSRLAFGREALDLGRDGLELPLFQMLSELIPPGGHIMVEYDSPSQRASERVLTLGYPPVASPLGYLLFQVGCRSFRDWYISEGGREGPRKLQGFKPLNEEIAREKSESLRGELYTLMSRPNDAAHGEWGALARRLGREALTDLGPATP